MLRNPENTFPAQGDHSCPTHPTQKKWLAWLIDDALPLWEKVGYNQETCLFHERLTFDGAPLGVAEQRLMVQARQVATYCRAAYEGVYGDGARALRCLEEMERRYHRPDGAPGWCFSIADNGAPASKTRDLYAHAFVIYAYFWAYRLSGEPRYLQRARATLSDVQMLFSDGSGGLTATHPASGAQRAQDPIMHLLEACLVWIPLAQDDAFQSQATQIVQLALGTLIDPSSGMLLETFDANWRPLHPAGQNRVEPGHLFEWSWLLRTYNDLRIDKSNTDAIAQSAERLFQVGKTHGLRHGMVIDAIDQTGMPVAQGLRIWPQTEFFRLLAARRHGLMHECGILEDAMQRLTDVFFEKMALPTLRGGWVDRLNMVGGAETTYMPASSLYHIYGAATAV